MPIIPIILIIPASLDHFIRGNRIRVIMHLEVNNLLIMLHEVKLISLNEVKLISLNEVKLNSFNEVKLISL